MLKGRNDKHANSRPRRVVIGVDTHKFFHAATALDERGAVLDTGRFSADRAGYGQLIDWATSWGEPVTFAIEGTGCCGAGLVAAVGDSAAVVEVMRTDRHDRRLRGESDVLDAENAARAVLGGYAGATPKSADGVVEMIRQVKIAKDAAVKARTAAMTSLKTVLVNAPGRVARAAAAAAEHDADPPVRSPTARGPEHH